MWETVVPAVAQIAGGLFGKKKSKGPSIEEQISNNTKMQSAMFDNMMGNADRNQISRLAVLGMNPASGVQQTLFDDGGSDNWADKASAIADMGQGISGALSSGYGAEAQTIQDVGMDQLIEHGDLENERLRSEIGLMRQAGASKALSQLGLDPDVMTVPKEIIANDGLGTEKGVSPALQDFNFPGVGNVRSKSNALSNAMEDSIVGNLMVDLLYTVPDIAIGAVKRAPQAAKDYAWTAKKFLDKNRYKLGSAGPSKK